MTWPGAPQPMNGTTGAPAPCEWCSNGCQRVYHNGLCPRLKAVRYYPDGRVSSVEFHPVAGLEAGDG